jgi:hypothetical protein
MFVDTSCNLFPEIIGLAELASMINNEEYHMFLIPAAVLLYKTCALKALTQQ